MHLCLVYSQALFLELMCSMTLRVRLMVWFFAGMVFSYTLWYIFWHFDFYCMMVSFWWSLCYCNIFTPEMSGFCFHNNIPQQKVLSQFRLLHPFSSSNNGISRHPITFRFQLILVLDGNEFMAVTEWLQRASPYWVIDGEMGFEVHKTDWWFFLHALW